MECLDCGYETKRSSDWNRHLNSQKHIAIVGHTCKCGQRYGCASSLRRHERACHRETMQEVAIRLAKEQADRDREHADLQRVLIEQNTRLAAEAARHADDVSRLFAELAARPQTVMNNCTFNLATFLNETCKRAPTLEQFLHNIPVCLDSDKSIGQYVVDQLAKCEVTERPIHCTDVKRGKLAVKQENAWVQDPTKVDPLVQEHIFALRMRCLKHLNEVWCLDNPQYEDPDSKQNDEYQQFIISIMGDLNAKFLNHVAKVTPIPKDTVVAT